MRNGHLALAFGVVLLAAVPGEEAALDPAPGFATITEADLRAEVEILASAAFEGRDSPSRGLTRAAEHIAARMEAAGFRGAGQDGSFLIPFTRRLPAPVADGCELTLLPGAAEGKRRSRSRRGQAAPVPPPTEAVSFTLGTDFVPVWQASGKAEGEVVVLGFGIDSNKFKYDDIKGDLAHKIAVIVQGEPRHKRKFEGSEVTAAADLYTKLKSLQEARVAGVLVVRRPPPARKGERVVDPAELGFRHTWAAWAGDSVRRFTRVDIVALEISAQTAERITGIDVLAAIGKVDKTAKAPKPIETGRRVAIASKLAFDDVPMDNVVGILKGSDPELADEYIVVGAHYDHVGVDPRGRIGIGADDNASGTAALLEIAAALATSAPRRSILACAFAAEEDGLVGSQAIANHPPVPLESLAAMVNMDMLGRGEANEVVVIGVPENPGFEKLLQRARRLQPTKIKTIVTRKGRELFQRSDHFSFHQVGVPALFFFEGLPVGRNLDYHTWRDTIDGLDFDKLARSTRLVFNTVWLLANDDERPPKPKH